MGDELVSVQATAKGFFNGPREPGDKFQMPLNKDGSQPKGSWFTVLKQSPAKKAQEKKSDSTVLTDEDLA